MSSPERKIIDQHPVGWLGSAGLSIIDGGGDGEASSCVGLDQGNKSDLTDIEYYRLRVKMKRSAPAQQNLARTRRGRRGQTSRPGLPGLPSTAD